MPFLKTLILFRTQGGTRSTEATETSRIFAKVFCGIEPKAGVYSTKVTPTRSSPELADFLLEIAGHYPAADIIHLVLDNLSLHRRKAIVESLGEKIGGWLWDRFAVHYTPKHGSWLDQAEIGISCSAASGWANAESLPSATFEGKPKPGPQDEPRPRHHRLGVHTHKSTPEVRLQKTHHYAVRDLANSTAGQLVGTTLPRQEEYALLLRIPRRLPIDIDDLIARTVEQFRNITEITVHR